MKTIYFTAASLDGYIADPNDSLEWLFKNGPSDLTFIETFMETVGALAMGASTYKWMQRHAEEWPYKVPCFVFTHQNLQPYSGADIRFVQGDVATHHKTMQGLAQGRNIWVVGGGDLAGQFYDQGLLDEMHIQTVAVFLNQGKKLFARQTDTAFKIKEIRQHGDTCVEVIYSVTAS